MKPVLAIIFLILGTHALMSQNLKCITPENFELVRNYILKEGDSTSINVSSRTDRFSPVTYFNLQRKNMLIQADESDRIYFTKDAVHLGNLIRLNDKTVETEIIYKDSKTQNEKLILAEFCLLVKELTKSKK